MTGLTLPLTAGIVTGGMTAGAGHAAAAAADLTTAAPEAESFLTWDTIAAGVALVGELIAAAADAAAEDDVMPGLTGFTGFRMETGVASGC